MRLTTFAPGVFGSVILIELEVSTTRPTPCCAASGIMASVIELPQAPMMTGTLSRTMSFSAALRVSAGSDLLSSMINSSLRPLTPPLPFTRSSAILAPLVMYEPAAAMGPDSGWISPTFKGSCCASVGHIPPAVHASTSAVANTSHVLVFIAVLLSFVERIAATISGHALSHASTRRDNGPSGARGAGQTGRLLQHADGGHTLSGGHCGERRRPDEHSVERGHDRLHLVAVDARDPRQHVAAPHRRAELDGGGQEPAARGAQPDELAHTDGARRRLRPARDHLQVSE